MSSTKQRVCYWQACLAPALRPVINSRSGCQPFPLSTHLGNEELDPGVPVFARSLQGKSGASKFLSSQVSMRSKTLTSVTNTGTFGMGNPWQKAFLEHSPSALPFFFVCWFGFNLRATSGSACCLLLALCSGSTPGDVQGTTWGVRELKLGQPQSRQVLVLLYCQWPILYLLLLLF